MKILSMALALMLTLTIVACGGDDKDEPVAIADATSCDQVVEAFFPVMQDVLDAVSDLSMADLMSDDLPEPLMAFEERMEEIGNKAEELNCSDDDMSEKVVAGLDDLKADGPVAEFLLEALRTEGLD